MRPYNNFINSPCPEPAMAEEKTQEPVVSAALKAESGLKSSWFVLTPEGEMHSLAMEDGAIKSDFDFTPYPGLATFAKYEMAKVRAVHQIPPHVTLMRKLEIADYEPGSDKGNMRFYPHGRLIKKLLERFVTESVVKYGAMEMEAPIMYDFEHPSLKRYLDRFPARQYVVESDKKKFFLRFAACFGQFLMAHDMVIPHRSLPAKLFEMTRYSFRLEQSGELVGLRRLRAFTMPDCHALCRDIDQAVEELQTRFELARRVQRQIGFELPKDLEMAVRVVKEFYDKNKDLVLKLVRLYGKPVIVEMWNERPFYFVFKYELNFVDALGKASALTTDQIDVESGERYDINYIDETGAKRHPIVLHLSPSGAIERVIYALLERAYFDEKAGKLPELPLWLAPEQVRVLPIAERHLDFARQLAERLAVANIRVGVDDRNLTLGKKVFDAKSNWVPYIIAVGDKETAGGPLNVVIRHGATLAADVKQQWSVEQFVTEVTKKTEGVPFEPYPLARELSKRPTFVAWSQEELK